MQPELDYAFLAQFAKVEADLLTAVGASFTRVASDVPSRLSLSIAARFRSSKTADDFSVEARVTSPEDEYDLGVDFMLSPSEAKNPYGPDDRVGLLVALNLDIPLVSYGLYTVHISIEEEEVRSLTFCLGPTD